ncbi:hypothetical protein NQ314_018026 [Rhamnusium bicolor]|uniref:Uncharacterized protein n=1 Tax=Rhamnusium bicolor TaxID=1586634 RepID=A0AAV8WRZ0_9CUCU|nr:hypothetical protein NQ314_018026 [Rhamnusium bicolor]
MINPRIKALSEAKYKQFRGWFDKRLDDAIAAAEAQEKAPQLSKVNIIQLAHIRVQSILSKFCFFYSL